MATIGEDDNSGGGSEAGLDASANYTLDVTGLSVHPVQGVHVKLTIKTDGSQGASVKHKVFSVSGCGTPPPTTTTTTTTTMPPSTTTSTTAPPCTCSTTTTTMPPTTATTAPTCTCPKGGDDQAVDRRVQHLDVQAIAHLCRGASRLAPIIALARLRPDTAVCTLGPVEVVITS
jgi:hypothetical protein